MTSNGSFTRQGVRMLRIHDLITGFEGLSVPGVAFYADRALILPGTVVVSEGPIDDHLSYLAGVGIGAAEVYRLNTESPVKAIAGMEDARAFVLDRVRNGDKLQFFSTTDHEQRLLEVLGLDWSQTFSAPPVVAREANDKARLRIAGRALGMSDAFPANRICTNSSEVYAAVGELLYSSDCDFIVLKRPDLASGDGMKLIERCREWVDAVDPYMREHAGAECVIVEAGYAHVPMSVQWEIDDGGPKFCCATAQLIDESFIHQGNILSSGDLPGVPSANVEEMRRLSEPFVRHYWSDGFRGVCGFDFLRANKTGRIYMLECNGRVTATTYALGLARQVAERMNSWAVVLSNVSTSATVRSFDDIRKMLGRRLFDGTKGALPFNVRCLQLDKPKLTVASVGKDVLEAEIILHEVKKILGA